jgi:hypothetical protein
MSAHDGDGRLMFPGGQLMAETDTSWAKGKRVGVVDRVGLAYFKPDDHTANMLHSRHSRYQSGAYSA